jgi:hypothetical protein
VAASLDSSIPVMKFSGVVVKVKLEYCPEDRPVLSMPASRRSPAFGR